MKPTVLLFVPRLLILLCLVAVVFSCVKKETDPAPQFPSYLRVPARLAGYDGSGQLLLNGDLSVQAVGPERLDQNTKTYSGIGGRIAFNNITANFTTGQPLPFNQTYSVPSEYAANGQLLIVNTLVPGTYPMGYASKATSTGANGELILNLAGPQVYSVREGTLTITDSDIIKNEGSLKLYRIRGTLRASLSGSGIGTLPTKDYAITGSFDLLLVD